MARFWPGKTLATGRRRRIVELHPARHVRDDHDIFPRDEVVRCFDNVGGLLDALQRLLRAPRSRTENRFQPARGDAGSFDCRL